ncbi:syntaxin-22-like [Olea europaea var. sylvestris]|uniref:Syntaxin-22-like n=1 Tax=Olea europaea subsp. europaea TaxID=158383 RepID=A0A8S0T6H5_OLEEU|nr:syntaxin-22-like [Olea europaea var. sylvestris]CAA2999294.1 syntaxin-22-like [Olea europaea subsp. europaea]
MSFEDLESGRALTSHASLQQDPSRALAAGVFRINTAVAAYRRLVNSLGTPKDTLDLRQKLHKTRLQIGQLVKETSAKLEQVRETDRFTEVSASKKLADAKLTKDYQSVLKDFEKTQKLAAKRETAYVPNGNLSSSNTANEMEIISSKSPEQISLFAESNRQEVIHLENEIVFNEAIIEEREQGIKEIQQQIGEVNEIFKDLAVLVHEQGSLIDDIGSNVEGSHAATTQATSQLTKAAKIQKSNSSLTCLMLLIVGIVLLIVVTVFVL